MRARKQSSTANPILFLLTDSTDHVTGKTGLVPVVTISKNGGAFGAALGAVAEVGNGWYSLAGNATDRNTVGELAVHAAVALADPYDGLVLITPLDPTDGVAFGMSALPAVAFGAANGLDSDIAQAGTAQAGAGGSITLAASANSTDLYYLGCSIRIVGGTGIGQTRQISGYVGATRVASVSRTWVTNPDNTSVYVVAYDQTPKIDTSLQVTAALRNLDSPNLGNGTAQAGGASTITLQAGSVATDDYYKGCTIKLYGGTGASGTGQTRVITGYVGATLVATVDTPWALQPDSTTLYALVATRQAALNTSLQPVASSVSGNVGGNLVGSVGSLAAQAQTDVESALTAQGLTTARAAKLDELDAAITSRMATFVYTAPDNADIATILTDVAAILARTDVATSTRLATAGYTAPDNADVATILTDVAAILARVDVAVSTRLASGAYTAPDNADILSAAAAAASAAADAASLVARLTGGRALLLDNLADLDATVSSRLAAIDYTAPANPDVSALAHLDADVSSRLAAGAYTPPDNADIAAILARTDVATSTRLATAGYTAPDNADIAAIKVVTEGLPTFPSDPASGSVVDSHVASAVDAAVSALAADIDTRLAASDYVAPQNPDVSALERLDVAVSTRLAAGGYTAPDNTDIEAIRAWIAGLTEPISLNLESAVGVDGSVTVRRGDSYTTGSKHGPLVWPGTATVWGAYVGTVCVFTARDPGYRGRSFALEAIFEDMGEDVIQCRVELPSAATAALSDQAIEEPWDFDVQATEDTLVDVTPIFGSFTILKDVTPPSAG